MAIETISQIEEALRPLEESVQAGDRQQFVALVEAIDWSAHRPEELLRAIDLALSLELAALAIKLAQQGGRLFPEHERIQQATQVLASPVGRIMPGLQAKDLSASQIWLREHASEYRGQWVAVREGQLLGAAESLQELTAVIDQAEDSANTIVSKVL